jgi:hypothetical protein
MANRSGYSAVSETRAAAITSARVPARCESETTLTRAAAAYLGDPGPTQRLVDGRATAPEFEHHIINALGCTQCHDPSFIDAASASLTRAHGHGGAQRRCNEIRSEDMLAPGRAKIDCRSDPIDRRQGPRVPFVHNPDVQALSRRIGRKRQRRLLRSGLRVALRRIAGFYRLRVDPSRGALVVSRRGRALAACPVTSQVAPRVRR